MPTNFMDRLKRLFVEEKAAPMFSSGPDYWGAPFFSLAPRDFDYQRTNATENSIAMICIAWICRNFTQARFEVTNVLANKPRPQKDHPLTQLIAKPNEWYSAPRLWAGTLLSFNVDGNAYWIKQRRGRFGPPEALWYVPHWEIEPKWPEGRTDVYISHYEWNANGKRIRVETSDVVHFRNGLDPANIRKGLAPLKSVLLEVFTDQEAARFTSALLKNMAVPGVIVQPGEGVQMDEVKASAIKQAFKRAFGGDNRGEPVVLNPGAEVTPVGFSPEQMNLESLRRIPEERISGALGIPPIVVGLGAGLQRSTFSNTEQANTAAFEQNLVPTWMQMSDDITTQLLPDFDSRPTVRAHFETQGVKALMENEDSKQTRFREAFKVGAITLNEVREGLGFNPVPEGDYFLQPGSLSAQHPDEDPAVIEAQPPPLQLPPAPEKALERLSVEIRRFNGLLAKASMVKAVEWEGLKLSRQPNTAEQLCVKGIAESQEDGKQDVARVLLQIRATLIEDAAAYLTDMSPGDYHKLVLKPSNVAAKTLKQRLREQRARGRELVTEELSRQGQLPRRTGEADKQKIQIGKNGHGSQTVATKEDEEEDELDTLTGATLSRVTNDVQARATGLALGLVTLGLVANEFRKRLSKGLDELSTAPQEQAAAAAVNRALSIGRAEEMRARASEIDRYQYSALLDANVCETCKDADGMEAEDPSDLPPAPNPECDGLDKCRCFILAVTV